MAGSDNEASRRITRLLDAQRLGPGRWQRYYTKGLDGDPIELFMGKDKSKQQSREEAFLKKAKKILDSKLKEGTSVYMVKHRKLISVDWKDLLQLTAPTEDGRPILKWKAGVLQEHQLDRPSIEEEIHAARAPRQRQEPWDG